MNSVARFSISVIALSAMTACGGFRQNSQSADDYGQGEGGNTTFAATPVQERETTIWEIFAPSNEEVELKVNKYIWTASLETLDFLPIESVDPFSGVITTGYGTPPGGGQSYRATIFVRDPALDARSLHIAMQRRNGRAVPDSTVRAVEDAILARARQLRIRDGRF